MKTNFKLLFLIIISSCIFTVNLFSYEIVINENVVKAGERTTVTVKNISVEIISVGLKDVNSGIEYRVDYNVSRRSRDMNISFSYNRAGDYQVYFNTFTGKFFSSDILEITASDVHKFDINMTSVSIVNQPFNVKVTVKDRFNNIVRNYDEISRGFYVETSKGSRVFPSFISSLTFINGVSEFNLVFQDEIPTQLIFRDPAIDYTVHSDTVYFDFGVLKTFEIVAVPSVSVNDSFAVVLTAYDNFNNIFRAIDNKRPRLDIELIGSGNLSLLNDAVSFNDGVTKLYFKYDKVEDIDIVITDLNTYVSAKTGKISVVPEHFSKISVDYNFINKNNIRITLSLHDKYDNLLSDYNFIDDTMYVKLVFNDGTIISYNIDDFSFSESKFQKVISLENDNPFYIHSRNSSFISYTTSLIINPFVETKYQFTTEKLNIPFTSDISGALVKSNITIYDEFLNISNVSNLPGNIFKLTLSQNLFYDEILIEKEFLTLNNNSFLIYTPFYDEDLIISFDILDDFDNEFLLTQANLEKVGNNYFLVLTFSNKVRYNSFLYNDYVHIYFDDVKLHLLNEPVFSDNIFFFDTDGSFFLKIKKNDLIDFDCFDNMFVLKIDYPEFNKLFLADFDVSDAKVDYNDDYLNFLKNIYDYNFESMKNNETLNFIRRSLTFD